MLDAVLSVLTSAAAMAAPCPPIPGTASLLTDRKVQWIVVGEQHGTMETPQAFGDLACLAARTGRPLTIALELPDSEQAALDAYLASDGGAEARAAWLAQPMWKDGPRDGRSSVAMLGLIERLLTMRREGQVTAVVAMQPMAPTPTPESYEKAMAAHVEHALGSSAGKPGALVLTLVGNVHARRAPVTFGAQRYMPMAGWLPGKATVTLDASGNGGAQWSCFADTHTPPLHPPAKPAILAHRTSAIRAAWS
ncbi:hypothetical protein [Novosphingobium sp. 9]|uniref:hypothetical protein n=1 Tax=Novosphingobium sp. 9 TaxID=2025349 RepID=UPI0021B57D5A|nr:hypothetical protein [Novosphingobium sp. 9]